MLLKELDLKKHGRQSVVGGEDNQTAYIARLGFFRYSPNSRGVGYLDMTTYLLLTENAETAVNKIKSIAEDLIKYFENANWEIDGNPVCSDYIGILNFEQISESLENGAELFNEVVSNQTRENAFRHVMTENELKILVCDEKKLGKTLTFKPEFTD